MSAINGGRAVRVFPLTIRDFSGLQGGMNQVITTLTHIPVGSFTQGDLMFRLHTGTIISAGTSLVLGAHADGYCDFDPSMPFDNTLASVTITSWTAPQLQILAVPAGFGRYLRTTLSGIQSAVPQQLIAALSVELVLKGGDSLDEREYPNEARGYGIE